MRSAFAASARQPLCQALIVDNAAEDFDIGHQPGRLSDSGSTSESEGMLEAGENVIRTHGHWLRLRTFRRPSNATASPPSSAKSCALCEEGS